LLMASSNSSNESHEGELTASTSNAGPRSITTPPIMRALKLRSSLRSTAKKRARKALVSSRLVGVVANAMAAAAGNRSVSTIQREANLARKKSSKWSTGK
jgi:hypothetical protein